MKVTTQRVNQHTYVNIEGEGYNLSIQTNKGAPDELRALAAEAGRNAARMLRRESRLLEAASVLEKGGGR